MDGWKCPGCGRCYGPFVQECAACNALAQLRQTVTATGTIFEERCPSCGGRKEDPGGTACGTWHHGSYCVSSEPKGGQP